MQSVGNDGLGKSAWRPAEDQRTHTLPTDPVYWFSMFAASVFGTNVGDFWVDGLGLDRWTSFASLVIIAGLATRACGQGPGAAYWIAVVALRAAATNIADFLTHDLKLGFAAVSLILALATIFAGRFTRADKTGGSGAVVDGRYWVAMLLAGLFGTTAGDLASHMIGLYAAAGLLSLTLVAVICLRSRFAPASVIGYWCIILAERCAGTPAGDALASERAIDLGLPLAMACSCGLLLAGLAARMVGERSNGRA